MDNGEKVTKEENISIDIEIKLLQKKVDELKEKKKMTIHDFSSGKFYII